ncbi:MAG: T9SS type A sorting domain-containing protein, partial [Candidatus Odinarchaeota archaeon]
MPNELIANAGDEHKIEIDSSVTIGSDKPAVGGTLDYTYIWSPSTTLDDPYLPNPVANPVTTTTYTLTVVDANNCIATDKVTVYVITTGIMDKDQLQFNCIVFPNPTSGVIELTITGLYKKDPINISLSDILGNELFHKKIHPNNSDYFETLDISNCPAGIYVLKISETNTE